MPSLHYFQLICCIQVWPASAREVISVGHWKYIEEDDSVLFILFSDPAYENLREVPNGNIRARLYPSGYLLKSTANGTLVKYLGHVSTSHLLFSPIFAIILYSLLQIDMLGTLPAAVISVVCYQQANIIHRLKAQLEKDQKHGNFKPKTHAPTYAEMFSLSIEFFKATEKDLMTKIEQEFKKAQALPITN